MPTIQLSEEVYAKARLAAIDSGFESIDSYVADCLPNELSEEEPPLAVVFTPERMAQIEKAAAQVRAGEFFTSEQVDAHFARKKAEWVQAHRT